MQDLQNPSPRESARKGEQTFLVHVVERQSSHMQQRRVLDVNVPLRRQDRRCCGIAFHRGVDDRRRAAIAHVLGRHGGAEVDVRHDRVERECRLVAPHPCKGFLLAARFGRPVQKNAVPARITLAVPRRGRLLDGAGVPGRRVDLVGRARGWQSACGQGRRDDHVLDAGLPGGSFQKVQVGLDGAVDDGLIARIHVHVHGQVGDAVNTLDGLIEGTGATDVGDFEKFESGSEVRLHPRVGDDAAHGTAHAVAPLQENLDGDAGNIAVRFRNENLTPWWG